MLLGFWILSVGALLGGLLLPSIGGSMVFLVAILLSAIAVVSGYVALVPEPEEGSAQSQSTRMP